MFFPDRFPRFEKKNRDENLYFDRNDWGFVYIREDRGDHYLINSPVPFPNDAKTTICEKLVSKDYFERFCEYIPDLSTCKYAYRKKSGIYRAKKERDFEYPFIARPKEIIPIFDN